MWHGAVVRNPLSVKVTKPTLDEGNVNERHKNEKWHKEASQDISTTLDKYLKMEELEKYMEDKENIPPAKEVRKYQIKSLPQNSLGSSSPLMVPVPFKLPDSPEVPDSTDILASPLKQDSEFKRSFSVESLPEPGQKVKSSADSVNASKGLSVNELSDMASKIPTPVPKVGKLAKLTTASSSKPSGSIKQNALDKSKTPKPANFEGLSSGGILADFADGLLSSPKKGPKQVSKPNNESDSGKVPKTGLQKQPSNPAKSKRARDSSDTVPSRYESNDDSYVEEPEVKRPSRSTKKLQLTKKVEPVKPAAKKAILPNQHNEIEDLMSDVEPVSSQERKKTAKKAALRNVASDVEERLPKAYVPRRSPAGKGRKPLKPWLEDASTKSKSIAEKFNPVVSRMLTSPLVPESSKLLGKSTKPFSSNMKTASATKMGNLIARDVTKKKPVSTPVSLPKRPMLKHSLSLIEDSPAKLQKSPSCNPAYGTPLKLDLSLSQQSIDSNQLGGKYLLDETPLGKISRKIGQVNATFYISSMKRMSKTLLIK